MGCKSTQTQVRVSLACHVTSPCGTGRQHSLRNRFVCGHGALTMVGPRLLCTALRRRLCLIDLLGLQKPPTDLLTMNGFNKLTSVSRIIISSNARLRCIKGAHPYNRGHTLPVPHHHTKSRGSQHCNQLSRRPHCPTLMFSVPTGLSAVKIINEKNKRDSIAIQNNPKLFVCKVRKRPCSEGQVCYVAKAATRRDRWREKHLWLCSTTRVYL